MGKTTFLGLLFVLATVIVMTTSVVDPPPSATQSAVEKVWPKMLKEKESSSSESSSDDDQVKSEDSFEAIDDKKQMLCNVIVRATHDLHVYQNKSANEIIIYLDEDCKNLENEELIDQCHEMVIQHGAKIYEHVASGIEMSQVCNKIEDDNEIDLDDETSTECSQKGGNKCQCCKMHVEKRKMRLRFIVKQIAKKRMCMCKRSPRPHRCRQWIRRKEHRILKRIERICPLAVCKHLGYCKASPEDSSTNELLVKSDVSLAIGSPSVWLGLLDQEIEAHFTNNICSEFEKLQTLCVHVAASIDSRHYAKLYMTVIHNNTKWIDNELRKEVQLPTVSAKVELCNTCKNVIQSSTNFYLQNLGTVLNALDSLCEQSRAHGQCKELFNQQSNTIDAYLHSLKPDEFCSVVHHCSFNGNEKCNACAQRLQPRKDAALEAVNRFSVYFTELCTKSDNPQCQPFVSEMVGEARLFINEFDVQDTCLSMGFCGQNATHDVDDYEHDFIEEIGKEMCSLLGPFEKLCQQVVEGNTKQVQTLNLNGINIDDVFMHCEEKTDEESGVTATTDQCSQDNDRCQCCINRVIQKKKCLKKRVAKYVWHMLQLCKRCPAREKCEHYWEQKKACWDAKIDHICPKKVCYRMGYCKKAEISSMCDSMGPFSQLCKQALNVAGQLFEEPDKQTTPSKP